MLVTARNYLAAAVAGCLAIRIAAVLVTPLLPLLVGLLLVTVALQMMQRKL